MKKNMFLIVLVFFIALILLGNYVISAKTILLDQNTMSKTKENSGMYTSKVLSDTEEISLIDILSKIDISKEQEVIKKLSSNQEKLVQDEIPKVEEQKIINQTTEQIVEQAQTVQLSQATQVEIPQEEQAVQPKYSFLTTDGSVSNENIRTAEREIVSIPQSMLNAFTTEGWRMEVSNENISAKYFGGAYGNVMGVTITEARVIVIQNRESSIQSSIIHEFGHYIDIHFSFPSLSDEFTEIFYAEAPTFKSRIPNSSCVRNEMEFFAHTFYYLMKDPSKCTPRATEFVQRYMNSF